MGQIIDLKWLYAQATAAGASTTATNGTPSLCPPKSTIPGYITTGSVTIGGTYADNQLVEQANISISGTASSTRYVYRNMSQKSVTATDIPASGGSARATFVITYERAIESTYPNGNVSVGSYSSVDETVQGSYVTISTSLYDTVQGRTSTGSYSSVTTTYPAESGNVSLTCNELIYRAANAITDYSNPTVTASDPAYIPASGGYNGPPTNVSASQTYYYTSGYSKGVNVTSSTTFQYSKDGSNWYATSNSAGYQYYAASLGVLAQSVTYKGPIYISGTVNGKSGSTTVYVYQEANQMDLSTLQPYVYRYFGNGDSRNRDYSNRLTTLYFNYPTTIPSWGFSTSGIYPVIQYNRIRISYSSGATNDVRYDDVVSIYSQTYDEVGSNSYGIPVGTRFYRVMKVKQGSTYVDSGDGSYNGFTYELIGAKINSVTDSASTITILPGILVSIGQNDYYHYNRSGTTTTITRSDYYYKPPAPISNSIDFNACTPYYNQSTGKYNYKYDFTSASYSSCDPYWDLYNGIYYLTNLGLYNYSYNAFYSVMENGILLEDANTTGIALIYQGQNIIVDGQEVPGATIITSPESNGIYLYTDSHKGYAETPTGRLQLTYYGNQVKQSGVKVAILSNYSNGNSTGRPDRLELITIIP